MAITAHQIKTFARDCGFELAGVAPASPPSDFVRFDRWRRNGMAGDMNYLTDQRGDMRSDPRTLLPSVQSIVCVGKLYNNPGQSAPAGDSSYGRISRYAVGEDYHVTMRAGLKALQARIAEAHGEPLEARVCVDTAPLLERSLARQAGLGWIGKNTCLINQAEGSWFFLGEILLSVPIAPDAPPPDRCGTCRRCIDACPTGAIVPDHAASLNGGSQIDARLCISYLTIEHRGNLPDGMAQATGNHLFGCDICQEVCPWNRDAKITDDPAFQPRELSLSLLTMAEYSSDDFARTFRNSPVWRARYSGFLRNVAAALGNAGQPEARAPLERLAASDDPTVSSAAQEALARLGFEDPTMQEQRIDVLSCAK